MGARYLNHSALVAVRYLTAERLRWRRPHRATRVRAYAPAPAHPSPGLPILTAVLQGLRHLPEVA